MLGLAHRGFSLHDYSQHILHTLRNVGYYSALIGEEHLSKAPNASGYDRVAKIEGSQAAIVAPTAIAWLNEGLPQPFFLSVGFFETHREFLKPGLPDDGKYLLPPAPLPDTPQTRLDMSSFKKSAWELDRGMGAVLDALDANGLADNTLVICTTDHGIAFPRMKGFLTDHGIGVMHSSHISISSQPFVICSTLITRIGCKALPFYLYCERRSSRSMMPFLRR